MTDHDDVEPAQAESLRVAPGGDPMLAELIATLNEESAAAIEISVTLIVSGSVLRGRLMPARTWLARAPEGLARAVVTPPDSRPDTPHEVESAYSQLPSEFKDYVETAPLPGMQIAHLRVEGDEPAFYRIRLEEISGWAFD